MKKGKKLYEGKAKIIYATDDKNLVIQYFKDDATAFNNLKKSTIEGKGVLNNRISEHILTNLEQIGIKTHLVKRLNMREQIIKFVEIIPIEFIIRNVATGSITKRLGIEDGTVLKEPLLEFCLKDDKLGDPLIAEEHILAFDWASKQELEKVKKMILRINDFMIGMFRGVGIKLIDFKLEFGRLKSNGKSTFSAAAMRFVFQIGQVRAVIDDTSIVELNAILNPSGDQRNLCSTHLMTPTRIRELIQEQKMKHEEHHDTVSKLQQELASLVEGEKHHQEHGLDLKKSQDQDKDSGRSLEKAVTGEATTEEQGKNNKAVGTGSVVNGGEQNTASGSLSVVGGGLKNAASDTLSVVGGGEKNKAAGEAAVVAGGKENETKGILKAIDRRKLTKKKRYILRVGYWLEKLCLIQFK